MPSQKLEHLLQHLAQDHKSLIELELKPAKDALISNALLRHDEADVRVTVVSCITEIIRMTAPYEPFNEDQMKDYFKLVNTAYRKLPFMAGRNHARAVSIIQAVSDCQICVRMLDFELHNTILEMFHLFLDGIQSNHPQEIFPSMEHIMTLIIQDIEESDEFMVELTKIFLAALKKGNENISPFAFQLARKVFEKCADSMHNFVPEAVRHMGDAVQEYDDVIVSSFLGATQSDNMNVKEIGPHACGHEQVNLAGDLILSNIEENYCVDNLKDIGNIDENHGTVPNSYDHTNRQENVSLDAQGMGIETSYHKEVNLQDDENVNENHRKVAHLGDQINWQESDLEIINSGPDGSTPCTNNKNSDEMKNFGSLTERNLLPLHATLTPPRQVSHVKDCDTIHNEDLLEKQNSPDAIIPVHIEGVHCEQQNLEWDDLPILEKRSQKPNSIIKPEEGYDPLWMLCEVALNEGFHHRKSGRNSAGFRKKNTISKISKSSSSSVREPMNAELRPQKKLSPEKRDDNGLYLLSTSVNNLGETVASKNIVDEECTKEKLEKSPEIHLLTCSTDGIQKNPIKRKRSVTKPRKKVPSKNIVFEAETSKDSMQVKHLKEANITDGIPKHLEKGLGTSDKADLEKKKGK